MARGWIHTVHRNDEWVNELEGSGQFGGAYSRKEDAVAAGRQRARQVHTEHVIHNVDGRIGERNSYGHDPFPPRG